MFHFGFSYVGLLYLFMLFIPNIIWVKNKPEGYDESAKKKIKFCLFLRESEKCLASFLC
jgi:hypothetical protein